MPDCTWEERMVTLAPAERACYNSILASAREEARLIRKHGSYDGNMRYNLDHTRDHDYTAWHRMCGSKQRLCSLFVLLRQVSLAMHHHQPPGHDLNGPDAPSVSALHG